MGFIRGKIESPRELFQRDITVGKPTFYFCERCKMWVDANTHEQVEVEVSTFEELMDEICKGVANE